LQWVRNKPGVSMRSILSAPAHLLVACGLLGLVACASGSRDGGGGPSAASATVTPAAALPAELRA
jgi:hypothetical protein